MAKVVLEVLVLIFERVKYLIFYVPTASASSGDGVNIFLSNGNICNPTVMIKLFPFLTYFPESREVNHLTSLLSGLTLTNGVVVQITHIPRVTSHSRKFSEMEDQESLVFDFFHA